jgi:hypothetical protein
MSQVELSRYAGVPLVAVTRLERLRASAAHLTVGQIVRVADALRVAPLDLVPGLAVSAVQWRRREAVARAGDDPVEAGLLVAERPEATSSPEGGAAR